MTDKTRSYIEKVEAPVQSNEEWAARTPDGETIAICMGSWKGISAKDRAQKYADEWNEKHPPVAPKV